MSDQRQASLIADARPTPEGWRITFNLSTGERVFEGVPDEKLASYVGPRLAKDLQEQALIHAWGGRV